MIYLSGDKDRWERTLVPDSTPLGIEITFMYEPSWGDTQ